MKRGLDDPALLVAGSLLALVTIVATIESLSWIGRPFAGFLLLENRVVASAGLASWPATHGGEIYQHELVSVEGIPLASARDLPAIVASLPVGTELRHRFRRGEREIVRGIPTRRFGGADYVLLFGSYLFCGLGLGGTALLIRYLRPRDRTADGSALSLWLIGMFAITATDLYGPYRLFRLHALLECLLFAGTLHMALVFPHPRSVVRRRPALLALPYAAAAVLALLSQVGLYRPPVYVATHLAAIMLWGLALAFFVVTQVLAYLRPVSFASRQRVKVVALGSVAAIGPQVILTLMSASSGGQASENLMGWSGVLFPLSIGFAVMRTDLIEVDAILRRTVNYAFLTVLVACLYATAVAGMEALVRDQSSLPRGAFVALFALASVMLLLPLRDRVQSAVDRTFFRSAYDFRRLVETTSERLASVLDLRLVAHEIERAVGEALHPQWVAFWVRRRAEEPLHLVAARGEPPRSPKALSEAASHLEPFDSEEGSLAVPFWVEGRLIALLLLGRRLSGRFYGGDDRRLLRTLANQGAVALENALLLERLRDFNRELEAKVEERTAELARALHELRETQAQLVHREKMASVGQLVAGVAHEMNNPLNFIEGNLQFLREYGEALSGALEELERRAAERGALRGEIARIRAERDLDYVCSDLGSVLDACQEGVTRATTLVRDLRTFSRLDLAEVSHLDLHEALESTLTLLKSRLSGVRVVKQYGELPPVECFASQINQVLMNLLANAGDAAGQGGTIVIRTLAPDGARIRIAVEDDGAGIAPEHLDRIFEPFFTTKDVGSGTGLGLSISYGVVQRHGGEIRVRSEQGRGTCFEVELPVKMAPATASTPDAVG